MTNATLERTAPTQNASATYMPQAQGQAADRRIKEKAPTDAPAKMGVRNLDLYYKDFHALKSIDLQFPENQVTALIGPSGCGKSTLLKSLNRMNDLVEGCRIEGEITLDG
ncbi:MAG: ATP-binding cassette domain-containing protein, partial [Eggerthella sp.]|nr:ATP-binding cassette domain-containing protein [Eggerthella sp.]